MANDITTQSSTLATPAANTKIRTFAIDSGADVHVQITAPANLTAAVAATTSTDTVIKNAKGILAGVLVTAAGTNAMSIYDNASGHTGTVVGYVPANAQPGSYWPFNMPCVNGITVQGNANNPGVTVAYA